MVTTPEATIMVAATMVVGRGTVAVAAETVVATDVTGG